MLRCCVCLSYFHFKCVNEDSKTTEYSPTILEGKNPEVVLKLDEKMLMVYSMLKTLSSSDITYVTSLVSDEHSSEQKSLQEII